MQSHLLVGPISVAPYGGALDSNAFLSAAPSTWTNSSRRRIPLVAASSSSSSSAAAINDGLNHYAVLGVTRTATAAEIKRAYRLLARKYHPDVSKDPHAAELFKSIRHAYEVLSNKATRNKYDQELQFGHKPYREKWSYSTEFEDQVRVYRWAHLRKKMHSERYWEHYNVNEGHYSRETDAEEDEGNLNEERGSFFEKLDTGYKIGYVIAWILGGRGGILLTLCLSFASWVCGKTSSSVVALVMVAMWIGSYLARYAPLPQGALLALLYMSIKLQSDLI
ncbi:uncharacterized protein LOC113861988 isoform X2 [Abrus precatorius]|uniref:Uncharacterized protein LOC113861988 isoform X2 n=1 Tax=Abrus precatorius TaxID=3816 RepID=A0A8B8L880_ABRPR|nr:uncharacterized protein LOC113861988 isoform X2 [Abrus precatorius]